MSGYGNNRFVPDAEIIYELGALCSLITEYNGDSVLSNTFINYCHAVFEKASVSQVPLLKVLNK